MGTRKPAPLESNKANRGRDRRLVSMDGFILRAGGVSRAIEVIDLNYGGCGIRSPVELEVGESVRISVLGRGSICAEVRWYHDGKAGLVFEPVSEKVRKQIERRATRTQVTGEIRLRAAGRSNYRVQVLDLSTDGCKVEMIERLSVGDQMLVKFEGLEMIGATVVWVENHLGGLRFERPFHPAVLDMLRARLGSE
ncbi:MAG TPA: PilZ domain-containing protein [Sphingomicrobium sp.]|nr:PilZ domain-containing protein [Sphingomicrobium sp.]